MSDIERPAVSNPEIPETSPAVDVAALQKGHADRVSFEAALDEYAKDVYAECCGQESDPTDPHELHTVASRARLLADITAAIKARERAMEQWRVEKAAMGKLIPERIVDRCPSCGSQNLFVGAGGHLTCSWIECEQPGVTCSIAALRERAKVAEKSVDRVAVAADALALMFHRYPYCLRGTALSSECSPDCEWAPVHNWFMGWHESPLHKQIAALREQMDNENAELNELRAELAKVTAERAEWAGIAGTYSGEVALLTAEREADAARWLDKFEVLVQEVAALTNQRDQARHVVRADAERRAGWSRPAS